uniref:Immunoglobulin superfamily member 9 n=1 Tax=Pseudonaja textilis TaxID=8673 RepID=A0A670YYK5_PSETE
GRCGSGAKTLSLSIRKIAGNSKAESRTVVGRKGESALLRCDLLKPDEASPPLYVIEWVRFGFLLPIFIKFGLYSPRVDPDYVGRVRIQAGASLQIDRLRAEDQGWYECRVLFLNRPNNDDEFQNGTWIHLIVNSPPVFQKTPPALVEIQDQKSVTLSCSATGNPPPLVSWKRDRVPKQLGHANSGQVCVKNGTLFISRVERTSAGLYSCHATNQEGGLIHTTRLLDVTVNLSQDAFFACRAEAYPANLTYSWFQGGTNVFHLSHLRSRIQILVDGSLLVQKSTPEDSGKYTCIPSNGLWKSPSASAFLTVLYPAQVAKMPPETFLPIGMQGIIRCPSRANPPLLSVSWIKDGQPLEIGKFPGWSLKTDGTIIIATSNDDALGVYACTPYNSFGTAGISTPTRALLKDPPTFTLRPKEEYFQEVGRELLIPCVAQGDPQPITSWTKSGILQYLSLPFFKEMNVDGDWPPEENEKEDGLSGETDQLAETCFLRLPDPDTGPPKTPLPGSLACPPYLCSRTESPPPKDQGWLCTLPSSSPSSQLLPDCPQKFLRGSLTSQSSGRGSGSFLRPPSLATSVAGSYLSSPFGDAPSCRSSSIFIFLARLASTFLVSSRRNTSVDENYEWDSEFALESELLDALQLYRNSSESSRTSPANSQSVGALDGSSSPLPLASPEERCAALRKEFLAYRRRREMIQQRRQKRDPGGKDERFEQATLF